MGDRSILGEQRAVGRLAGWQGQPLVAWVVVSLWPGEVFWLLGLAAGWWEDLLAARSKAKTWLKVLH
jgi:hypothetical protein